MARLALSPGRGLFLAPGRGLAAFPTAAGSFTGEFSDEFRRPFAAVGVEFTSEFSAEFHRAAAVTEPGELPVVSLPATFSVSEGSIAVVTLTKAGTGACSVTVRSEALTATAGTDYTTLPGTVVAFAEAETSRTVQVQTAADSAAEGDETFRLVLESPVGCTLGTAECTVTIVDALAPDPVGGTLLFSTTIENADTVPTWDAQELSIGQSFAPGDVPAGFAARCLIDGTVIPTQLSNRVFWTNGSLKWAQVRMLVPSVPAGGTKTITWQVYQAPWASHDAALHTSAASITSKVALEYRFTSFKGRNTSNVLTAERGPKSFASADMLAPANAAWIDTVMSGPVCTEWRATDMAKNADDSKDASLGCLLYARAWGGAAGNPRRIEFVFRSMYGWSDGIPSDQQGIRCSMDLLVNGTVVRGASLGTPTPGWSNRDSYNGGFYASAGPTGRTDWFDTATNSFVTPPRLVYRINTTYGVRSRFLPPYDTDNPKYSAASALQYQPQMRGTLSESQDAQGDHANLSWGTSAPFAAAMVAHARRPAAEIVSQAQNCRVTAWCMAALGSIGFNRTTRKLICHLPPDKNPDPTALGVSVYNGTKPQRPDPALNPYVRNQDAPHFPQVCWWTALTEGDQHVLDLAYAEATLPGLFASNGSGFYVTVPNPGGTPVPAGGIYFTGQTRGVGHTARPILNAMSIGNPADPHHKLVKGLWANYIESREAHIKNQDYWRNTSQPADGRYFRDLKMYPMDSSQEPQYKIWMHSFSLFSTTYGSAVTEDADALRLAQWWAHVPTVLCGGWHDDSNYMWKPDPTYAGAYYHMLANTGSAGTNNDRRPWAHYGMWKNDNPLNCTYRADGRTLQLDVSCHDGMIVTVVGDHRNADGGYGEPITMRAANHPSGLTRGIPYFAVQSSGNTCKISTTLGGSPVTFDTGGSDIAGFCTRMLVFGVPGHTMRTGANISVDDNSYHIQITAALDFFQHYVAPNDQRVRLARQKMKALKDQRGGGYDLRGKTTVPTT